MTYSVNGGYEKLVAHDGKRHEEVERDEGMDDDGSVLTLQLREETRREVVDSGRCAVSH